MIVQMQIAILVGSLVPIILLGATTVFFLREMEALGRRMAALEAKARHGNVT
jgi:hypothetical protein